MKQWQNMKVKIHHEDILSTQELTLVPKSKLLTHKVERAVKQYTAQGWQLDKIDFQDGDTLIYFRQV